jgi:hypothetical protein
MKGTHWVPFSIHEDTMHLVTHIQYQEICMTVQNYGLQIKPDFSDTVLYQ